LFNLMDTEACTALLKHWIDPLVLKLLDTANNAMDSLFRDRHRHAITYNHYFTENVQKIVNARNEKRLLQVLEQMFPLDFGGTKRVGPADFSVIGSMMSRTIADMDTRASIELLDSLEAFAKLQLCVPLVPNLANSYNITSAITNIFKDGVDFKDKSVDTW
jgi:hypothetical protein